jgi:glucose/arabinose dehydrogenase
MIRTIKANLSRVMKHNTIFFPLISIVLVLFTACQNNTQLEIPKSPFPLSNDLIRIDTLAEGFVIPFDLAILGDDEYFISDRIGKLFHFKEGELIQVKDIPTVTSFEDPGLPFISHGGLMDVSIHPNYPATPWVYMVYFSNGKCRVDRFQVVQNKAVQLENIFETRTTGYYGNGSRIVWEDDRHFFLNLGSSTISTNAHPIYIAQDLHEDWGKIHRLNDDGSIPEDNPILPGQNKPGSIWSYGHRDAQGLYYDKSTQTLFAAEHGPQGGDEFNIIVKGGNYGWPLFTYGIDYSGVPVSTISEDSATSSTILPEHYWTVPTNYGGQSIAPACMIKVDGSKLKTWNGHFLIGSLAYRRLLLYNRDTDVTTALPIIGRVRTVRQLPGGDILALVERDNLATQPNGKILRMSAQ